MEGLLRQIYTVDVKYGRKLRHIKVHETMSWLEFTSICKYAFDLPYTVFATIGGLKRDYLLFFDGNYIIRFNLEDALNRTLKDKTIDLCLMG